jgi:hypothetical protein
MYLHRFDQGSHLCYSLEAGEEEQAGIEEVEVCVGAQPAVAGDKCGAFDA